MKKIPAVRAISESPCAPWQEATSPKTEKFGVKKINNKIGRINKNKFINKFFKFLFALLNNKTCITKKTGINARAIGLYNKAKANAREERIEKSKEFCLKDFIHKKTEKIKKKVIGVSSNAMRLYIKKTKLNPSKAVASKAVFSLENSFSKKKNTSNESKPKTTEIILIAKQFTPKMFMNKINGALTTGLSTITAV